MYVIFECMEYLNVCNIWMYGIRECKEYGNVGHDGMYAISGYSTHQETRAIEQCM